MHTNQIVPDPPLLDLGPLDTELQVHPKVHFFTHFKVYQHIYACLFSDFNNPSPLQSIPLSGNTPPRAPFVDPGMSPGIVHHPNDGTEDLIIVSTNRTSQICTKSTPDHRFVLENG